jgi:demethylmenaquinone methyltransferase/2-methoxy-6-polyprenyl-1,4-benzoquinol methylase
MTEPSLSKAPDRIAGMFDAIADRYDLLNHVLSAGIDRRWRRRAIQALGLSGGERVLDLCTGTADLAIAARATAPGAGRVVGVDFADAICVAGLAAAASAAVSLVGAMRPGSPSRTDRLTP